MEDTYKILGLFNSTLSRNNSIILHLSFVLQYRPCPLVKSCFLRFSKNKLAEENHIKLKC
uniref:Uncharacterized protein n=1 Tax=Anguilla anguilla TaxID=7936 RepID=A0A0E9PUE7_ANGAN